MYIRIFLCEDTTDELQDSHNDDPDDDTHDVSSAVCNQASEYESDHKIYILNTTAWDK